MRNGLSNLLLVTLLLLLAFPALALAYQQDFRVERLVVAAAVHDREPVGVDSTLPADMDRIYAFAEARDISRGQTVSFVWYHQGSKVAKVPLRVEQGPRWRTFSSVRLADRTGDWRVELQDDTGMVVSTHEFNVR